MNTAKAGRRREHVIRDLFIDRGYVVVRSAGSLGPVDLVCIPGASCAEAPFFVILVQVKPRPLWRAERKLLEDLRKLLPKGLVRIEGWVLAFRKPAYRQFVF